jgi:diguanylate cyclase (GGDEF)-like protein
MPTQPLPSNTLLLTKGAVPAPPHPRESERLARLQDYEILDSDPEAAFDDLIALASYVTGTPLGAISFVDRDRQWFKATHGFEDKQTDRSIAFCAHAILETGPAFIVPDAMNDERFSGNPLVTGPPYIRFYAGVPMLTPDGLPLGSFCVMDRTARELTAEQIEMLRHIARIAMDVVESERHAIILEKHLIYGRAVDGELPGAISSLAAKTGPLHGLIDNLIGQYGPLLGGVHARVQRFRGENQLEAFYVPEDPPSEAHQKIWDALDNSLHPAAQTLRRGTLEKEGASSYFGLVPLGFAGRVLARVDLVSPIHDNQAFGNLFKLMMANFLSMAEREIRTQELRFLTDHDPLTGLGNRPPLIAEIDRSIRQVDADHPGDALVHLRLDGLSEINDNFGYAVGDRVLVATAQRLKKIQDGRAFVARIGGDKFHILLRNTGSTALLRGLLSEITACLDVPFDLGGEEIRLHASIGCTVIDDQALHPVEVLRRADVAMRQADAREKPDGPTVFIYDEAMFHERQQRHHANLLVRQAYDENRFFLLFQPVVDLEHARLGGAETLLRMRLRDGSVVQAVDFMPAIDRIRYQPLIDRWVFAEFIRLCRTESPAQKLLATEGFSLGLNATPALLAIPGFAKDWLYQLTDARITPTKLIIEIVENPLLLQSPFLVRNLEELREGGVRIAVDDFGSGYSNLRHLAKLPVDIVKLDRTFLTELDAPHHRGRALLQSMIKLCRGLGYDPLVEGVETAAHDAFVRDCHCVYAQGYFYGHPMPLEDLLSCVHSFSLPATSPPILA